MPDQTGSVLRKVKVLGFPTPHQLFLYEAALGFYWVGYGGMGTSLDTLVQPDDADAIPRLLASGLLVRTNSRFRLSDGQRAWRLVLAVDLTAELGVLPPHEAPDTHSMFLQKWRSRQLKSADFRGLVLLDLSRNPYETSVYNWMYYGGMGECYYVAVDPDDVPAIEALLANGTLQKGETWRHPLVDNNEEVATPLNLAP
jgi:hypothetical protein